MPETITRFEVPSIQEAREGPPPIGLIPVEAPTFPGLLFRTTTDEQEILAHDEARLFPTQAALDKHLAKYPCPRGLTRLFQGASSIPRYYDLDWDFRHALDRKLYQSGRNNNLYAIMDAAVATHSFTDDATLSAALNACGGSITFSDKWSAQRTAEKFRDLVVHQKGTCVVTRRQVKFTSKKRKSKQPASPITGEVDSAVAHNFKLPRHLYLRPVHEAFLKAMSEILTTPPTTPLPSAWENDERKWDGFDLNAWDGNTAPQIPIEPPTTLHLCRDPYLPSHPRSDPTLREQAELSTRWCATISEFLSSLRQPFTPYRGYYYNTHEEFKCGCFRTPLVYINRHRQREALVALSLYSPHLLALQTYPEACDRLPIHARNEAADAHFKLSVSLASFCLALHCKDFPSYNTDHLLPPPTETE